jgi:DNA repair ATPase RecN
MRYVALIALAISAALLPLGCKPNSPEVDAKVREAKKATGEAATALRDEYAKDMHKQLEDLEAKTAELKDKAAKATGEAKKKLEKKLEDVKAKHGDVAKKLDELKNASAEEWQKLKSGLGTAFDDLKKMIE